MDTIAKNLGATEFGNSKRKDKRFYVIFNGKIINFGSKTNNTFIDHGDIKKKESWIARHSKIKNKEGKYVIKLKTSPDFWSYRLLWD